MKIDPNLKPSDLIPSLTRLFEIAQQKIPALDQSWDFSKGAPVITVNGQYTSRAWTQWTQGFQFGSALLTFDATGDQSLLTLAKTRILQHMPPHLTHTGVHDHAFNNLSTYGNLRRLMRESRIPHNDWELNFYDLAIKVSGATQASRWSGTSSPIAGGQLPPGPTPDPIASSPQLGYIYSFNGPHSLFIDTMRTLRILCLSWQLGHSLHHENDRRADLLKRAVLHALTSNQFLLFHGTTSHTYDLKGRTAHEAIFNRNDGSFRSRSTQQGYSPYSTWTRGLAWAILGYAELLEFLTTIPADQFESATTLKKDAVHAAFQQAATETADHYLNDCTATDGIPYWDDSAPNLHKLGDWRSKPADPFNDHEPIDSSAAAIAAQGLLRLGRHLSNPIYTQSALTISKTLLTEPYLSTSPIHQGLLLHSLYHRPNNWDHTPPGQKIPCNESSQWGDYHLLELSLLLHRLSENQRYLTFFDQR